MTGNVLKMETARVTATFSVFVTWTTREPARLNLSEFSLICAYSGRTLRMLKA